MRLMVANVPTLFSSWELNSGKSGNLSPKASWYSGTMTALKRRKMPWLAKVLIREANRNREPWLLYIITICFLSSVVSDTVLDRLHFPLQSHFPAFSMPQKVVQDHCWYASPWGACTKINQLCSADWLSFSGRKTFLMKEACVDFCPLINSFSHHR